MIVQLPFRLKCSREETESGQQRLIETHWQMIAAIAWAGYLECGRGAVWIDLNDYETGLTGEGLGVGLRYCSLSALEESGLMRKPEIAEVVKSYDARREIIVALLLKDGCCSVDRYSSNGQLPDPPASHARQMEVKPPVDPQLN